MNELRAGSDLTAVRTRVVRDPAAAPGYNGADFIETADKCLQMFGGWGYMWEYPIARAYADARIVKIAGGSIEIMKTIIAREMFKGRLKLRRAADA